MSKKLNRIPILMNWYFHRITHRILHNRMFFVCDTCGKPLKILGKKVFHVDLCPPF